METVSLIVMIEYLVIFPRKPNMLIILYYLELTGQNGIVLNPSKFHFMQKEIQFPDFQVISNDVNPLPKFLETKPLEHSQPQSVYQK